MDLLIIALLILLNGLFVAAEFAFVRVRRSRIEQLVEQGSRGAKRVERQMAQSGRVLAAIQVGITFVGFLAAAFAGASIVDDLARFLATVPLLANEADVIALLIVTTLISLVTIVFGEQVPKILALAHAERTALIFAIPIDVLGWVLKPVVWPLNKLTQAITRLFGVTDVPQERLTAEELMILVERGGEQGEIEAEEQQMIGAVLELGQQHVHEVMVPRIDIAALPVTATVDDMVATIVKEGHSRIPIYEDSIDKVVGILYAKDLLPLLKGGRPLDVRKIVRPPVFVPESISVDDLLHQLQRQKVHIAIVLDEYGGTAGLVTIEDLIEQIVGEIQDEYDAEEPMLERLDDDRARFDGRASVDDLTNHFGIQLDDEDKEQYDTVGGLVFHEVGGVPSVGDTVDVDGLTLTVESTDGRRVGKVLVVRRQPVRAEETEESEAS